MWRRSPLGYELARVDAGTDPANRERGIYRLAVRFSGAPNHNPELLDVTLPDGGPLQGAVLPLNQEIRLYPHIPDGGPGGIETYPGLDGGVQHERFSYSWAATAGEVVEYRSAEPMPEDPNATSDIRFRTHETPTPVRFYVVLRDLRGGVVVAGVRRHDRSLSPRLPGRTSRRVCTRTRLVRRARGATSRCTLVAGPAAPVRRSARR